MIRDDLPPVSMSTLVRYQGPVVGSGTYSSGTFTESQPSVGSLGAHSDRTASECRARSNLAGSYVSEDVNHAIPT